MGEWDYNPSEYTERNYEIPENGSIVWCKIIEIIDKMSSKGNPMLEFHLEVMKNQQGEGYMIWNYIVKNEFMNSNIGDMLNSIEVDGAQKRYGNVVEFLKNKVVAVRIKHELTNTGNTTAKVHYFVSRKSPALPPFPNVPKADISDHQNQDSVPF